MSFRRPLAVGALAALALATAPALASPASATSTRTTAPAVPAPLPNHLALAHLDDAPGTDVLQYDHNRLFVSRTDYAGSPVMHHWYDADVNSLIVGDFSLAGTREHGHDQVCAVLTDGSMECEAPSDDKSELWWWFTQANPLHAGEQAVVGDFDGDGADDLLAFAPAAGTVRLLSRVQTGFFAPVSNFSLGNLSSLDLRGKQLYAGEFGQAAHRSDLVVVDPATRQVLRYDTATDSAGRTTFWWAFTTAGGTLRANEQVTVANVDGGSHDALILRDPATGLYRFVRAEYDQGHLLAVPASLVTPGQLPVTTHTGQLVAASVAAHPGEPGQGRDDTLFFDRTAGTMAETGARHDGTRFTYWWGWTKAIPVISGWAPRQDTKMAVVLCKLADVSRTPDATTIKNKILGRGVNSVRDYLFDTTYGTIDIANAVVKGWVTATLKAADSSARGKTLKTADYIADCAKQAGIDTTAYAGHLLVVLNDTNVAFQGINGFGAAVQYDAVLAGAVPKVAHEALHGFGLNHANDDTTHVCGGGADGSYCDTADVMGNFYATQITHADGSTTGPLLNGAHRHDLGTVPAAREVVLDPATAPARTTLTLAPVEQPEASGTLLVTVKTAGSGVYTVEYRRPVGLDARTGADGVQVHLSAAGWTTLQTAPVATLAAGATATAGAFRLHVDAVDPATGHATVTLTH